MAPVPPPARARLMLILPPAPRVEEVTAWIAAGDVAAVVAPVPPGPEPAALTALRALGAAVQKAGAAFLVLDQVDLASAAQADGVHLSGLDALRRALPKVKPDGIAGAGALPARHEAMEAGEAGADYVMFGGPGALLPFERVLDLVQWWADLFEVPCVGVAGSLAEAGELARAGADFIALSAPPAGAEGVALIRAVDAAIGSLEPQT